MTDEERIGADLGRYAGLGIKVSGGAGDTAAGDWLADELAGLGFAIERQSIRVPWFEVETARIEARDASAAVLPQAIVTPTGAGGVTGPLVRVDAAIASAMADRLRGAIALVDLPFARWSSIKPVRHLIETLLAAGARAVLLVTNGPTGEAIALNADGQPAFAAPVAILAPRDAAPFFVAATRGDEAALSIAGRGGERPAFNVVARRERGHGRWLVVSTPRSGWFGCAGERGPGVAVWLGLARWAVAALPDRDLAFICSSGHEYGYVGADRAIALAAPAPNDTELWLHLGSNVATRDRLDIASPPLPLTTADPQRRLVASPALLEHARRAFAGQPGLADPQSSNAFADGELQGVIAAGYPAVVGIFGAHRFHHTAADRRDCLLSEAAMMVLRAFREFLAITMTT